MIVKKIYIFILAICFLVCLYSCKNNKKEIRFNSEIRFDSYDEMTIRTLEDPNSITKIYKKELIKDFEDIINQAELIKINNTNENGWIILCNIYKNKQITNSLSILNNTIRFDKKTYKINKEDYERIVGYIKKISEVNTYNKSTN